jgi:hypothetical protein
MNSEKLMTYFALASQIRVGRGLVYAWAEQRNQVDHVTHNGQSYVVINDKARARLEDLLVFWRGKADHGEKVANLERVLRNLDRYGQTRDELGIPEVEGTEELFDEAIPDIPPEAPQTLPSRNRKVETSPQPARTPSKLPERYLFRPTTREEEEAVGDARVVELYRALHWVGLSSVTCIRLPCRMYKKVGESLLYRVEDVEAYRAEREAHQ